MKSDIFVEHALYVAIDTILNPGLMAVRLVQRAQLWPSVYHQTDARSRKNQFDERKQDWLVQKFGLRLLQRFDVIQAEPPFLLLVEEDKRKLSS